MKRRSFGIAAAVAALGSSAAAKTWADEKKERKGTLTFEIYKDAKQEVRWRLKSANGQVIASSGQGYKAMADCQKAIAAIKEGAAKAKIKDTTKDADSDAAKAAE